MIPIIQEPQDLRALRRPVLLEVAPGKGIVRQVTALMLVSQPKFKVALIRGVSGILVEKNAPQRLKLSFNAPLMGSLKPSMPLG